MPDFFRPCVLSKGYDDTMPNIIRPCVLSKCYDVSYAYHPPIVYVFLGLLRYDTHDVT